MVKLNKKSGFTLLELVIVIIIIGVLASIAIPKMTGIVETSRTAEALTNLGAYRDAFYRCAAKNTTFAAAQCDLTVAVPAGVGLDLAAPGGLFRYSVSGQGGTPSAPTFLLKAENLTTLTNYITMDQASARLCGGVYAVGGVAGPAACK